jgi:hypothetical protein
MSNPTTPFSWQMPTATDLVTDLPADFEVFGQAVATSLADLLGGTTGQVLSKTSNTDMDFTWVAQDDSNAIQNAIVDAKGDLIAATAADTPARLAVGTNGQILTADSTAATGMKWATPAGGGKVLQVVYAESSSDVSISTTTPTDSGNSATITPTSATSKILVLTTQIHELKTTTTSTSIFGGLRLVRGATSLQSTNQDGAFQLNSFSSGSYTMRTCTVLNYLDSPATTSATTYKTQAFCDPTYTIRFGFDNAWSSITLMEIGA